jgi:nicotinate-nucleotide--dimethylbenzimidazole phosphoribosyltransferase
VDRLRACLDAIAAPDQNLGLAAQEHLDQLTKPVGSLGRLEELARRIVEITGKEVPAIQSPAIFTLAADHGVVAEGVSAYPQVVTAQMVENFLSGGAAVNVLTRQVGARVIVADFGVATPLPSHPRLVVKKIGDGTRNLAREAAMTREQAVSAIESGIELVEHELPSGLDLIGTGEMGIGNTTPSSAITAVITGRPTVEITGRGTGIDSETWRHKVSVVNQAIERHQPDPNDALDVLAKVGGFEIGGLVGVIIAGAANRIPVILDGFISGAAALLAATLSPHVRHYLIAGHSSAEPGHRAVLMHLRLKPYLDLNMRLGEGTGAALAIGLCRAAVSVYNEMATFKSAGVSTRSGE